LTFVLPPRIVGRASEVVSLRAFRTLLLPIALLGCAGSPPSYRYVEAVESEIDDLATELRLERTTLEPNDTTRLVVGLTNVGPGFMQFRFPPRRQIGLAIYEADGELYFTDVDTIKLPRVVPIGPLQTWTREIDWDGAVEMSGERRPLPPGRYEIQVALRREGDVFVNRSNRVAVEILGP
jgi:hypothetical protein